MDGKRLTEVEVVEFIRSEYDGLVRAVAVACGSLPMAEDAVQEALAKGWERAGRGERFVHFGGWVVTVALNHSRSGLRRRATEQRALERVVTNAGADQGLELEDRLDLQHAVTVLPLRQRQAVVLYYLLGLDVAAIATVLEVSTGTVKTALSRARATLARSLGQPDRPRSPS